MDQASLVREKTDIVELIREYIPLKKAGRNFRANCPFHQEKSPSFFVSPERQMFHCFGCGKGGDAYTFLMEYEHMEFIEALRTLAKKAGVTLTETSRQGFSQSKKERLYEINSYASQFYNYLLLSHRAGRYALSYLTNRGVNTGAIGTFKLGFAPKSGTALIDYLTKKKKVNFQEMIEAGLAVRYSGRTVDFFRDRVIFSLTDHRDNIIGFSGRVLEDVPNAPKYINTRDTLIYHKGENFFGFNIARDEIRKTETAIVVEGEFDVISCFQEGITNAIALKGTAMTERQVSLIGRFATRVILALDFDKAGQEALVRSLPLLEKASLHVSVLVLEEGKDPAEVLSIDPGGFKKALKNAEPVYDFLITKSLLENDPTKAEGKREITEFLLPFFSNISNEVVKEHYLRKLSTSIDTTYDSLQKELERRQKNVREEPIIRKKEEKKPRRFILNEYLLALVVQAENPKKTLYIVNKILDDEIKTDSSEEKVLKSFLDLVNSSQDLDINVFESELGKEMQHAYNKASLFPLPELNEKSYYQEVEKVSKELLRIYLREDLNILVEKIKSEDSGNENTQVYQEKYRKLRNRLSDLKN